MTIKRFRQPDCKGTDRKVGKRKTGKTLFRSRDIRCPDCGRTVAINYDGRIRHHVAELVR